jgi:DsbC/DsbD-like thiol-disulfide interchange protein
MAREKFRSYTAMMPMRASIRLAAGCTLLIALADATGAVAADAGSRWDGDARSAARLIAGPNGANATTLRAGVEIRLAPGWHTYWRYPGDSGVPPQFDFKASTNVKEVRAFWPAPQRLSEAGSTSIGYVDDVILPLRVVPLDAAKPVALRLKLAYAVCNKLCVPASAVVNLALGAPETSVGSAALAAAEARVPKKVALGEGQRLSIRDVRRDSSAAKPRVLVDVAAPPGGPVDLFAEGPNPRWALPVPSKIGGAPAGLTRFAFALDGAPPGVHYKGAQITLTAVAKPKAIEVSFHLD